MHPPSCSKMGPSEGELRERLDWADKAHHRIGGPNTSPSVPISTPDCALSSRMENTNAPSGCNNTLPLTLADLCPCLCGGPLVAV